MEEGRWTDRVFSFHKNYLNYFLDEPIPTFDSDFLFSTLTGNVGNALYFPINAVRWYTPSTDIAILVTRADTQVFQADFYHFGMEDREMEAEFFLLKEGEYEVRIREIVTKETIFSQRIHLGNKSRKIEMVWPSRIQGRLEIEPV